MIPLIGRRPAGAAAVAAQTTLAAASEAARNALAKKAAASSTAIFEELDFPNHWGVHKHHFLIAQYSGKCAFCETRTSSGYPGDVEHFRPKAYCEALGPASSSNDIGGQAPGRKAVSAKSSGYWWLAYEWSNYLYSCNRCNSTWKRNQFPVRGRRARAGGNLARERALLVNPFDVDPARHFDFNALTGQIRGLTDEGKATIQVCGLDRRSLDVDRAIKGAKLNKRLKQYVKALATNNIQAQNNALSALLDECRCKEPYAAMARVFVKNTLQIDYPTLLQMKRKRQI
ncbi:hypothetical protein [Variovorax sp.]|uniref:hypothetical protein n=1 Tax=Variovorax sp. TaxID=1871043 RepID=UPI003BAB1EAC